MKVVCLGSPPKDENGGVREAIRDEWLSYVDMFLFIGLIDETCEPKWVEEGNVSKYWLIPSRLLEAVGQPNRDYVQLMQLIAEPDVDRRFEWPDDPEHPLRVIARAWTRHRKADEERLAKIKQALTELTETRMSPYSSE
jgi:hypothetical protein